MGRSGRDSDLIRSLAKTKGQSEAATNKMLAFLNAHGVQDKTFYDCSGLGVEYLLKVGAIAGDMTANMLYNKCTMINKSDLRAADFVFFLNKSGFANHVGYMIDKETVVHALDQSVGVIKEKLSDRKEWVAFGRPNFCITYDIASVKEPLKYNDPIVLTESVTGYNSSSNAIKGVDPVTVYPPGTYYFYKAYGAATNITKHKGVAGAWVILP